MKLTKEEQETLIRTSAADREWDFFTLDPKFVRRVEKLGYKLEKDHQGGWSCRIPLDRITLRRPERRKLSKEHLDKLAKGREKSAAYCVEISDQNSPAMVR